MIRVILIVATATWFGCGAGFNSDKALQFTSGDQRKKEPETADATPAPAKFESGEETRIVRTDGLFGDGGVTTIDLPAAGIMVVLADGSEHREEIKIPNAEEFTLKWESKNVDTCKVSGARVDGTAEDRFSWDTTTGEEKLSKIYADTIFTIECTAKTETLVDKVTVKPDGGWIPVGRNLTNTQKNCSNFCSDLGMANTRSPDGWMCTSGETVPTSAIGFLQFHYGCWGGACNQRHGAQRAISFSQRCYGEGQKHDNDSTDITVGCYCIRTTN